MENEWGEKYVVLVADYAADGVMDRRGMMRTVADLPITDSLQNDILSWSEYYDEYCMTGCGENAMLDSKFPYEEFAERGLLLARRLKTELSEWRVFYVWEEFRYTDSVFKNRTVFKVKREEVLL